MPQPTIPEIDYQEIDYQELCAMDFMGVMLWCGEKSKTQLSLLADYIEGLKAPELFVSGCVRMELTRRKNLTHSENSDLLVRIQQHCASVTISQLDRLQKKAELKKDFLTLGCVYERHATLCRENNDPDEEYYSELALLCFQKNAGLLHPISELKNDNFRFSFNPYGFKLFSEATEKLSENSTRGCAPGPI